MEEMRSFLQDLLAEPVTGLERIGRGQSNPTYLLQCRGRKLVLRTKPPGKLLKSAHLVEREYRVMRCLSSTEIPVPEPVVLVNDADSPNGRAFYVMEFVDGDIHFDPCLPGMSPSGRAKTYDEMNRVLAMIHNVVPDQVGLADFGKPGNYFERQTNRWKRQYLASRTECLPEMERVIAWLEDNMVVDDGEAALVHGDYRLDNLVFRRGSGELVAVLDWELSTLGHPLADLAYQCMQWQMPHDGALRGLGGIDREGLGLPNDASYIGDYCHRRQMARPRNWDFYLVFAFFRLAAILEGVGRRALDGSAANPELAREYRAFVPLLARRAVEILG